MARNEPTLDQALVVVIDAITSLSPARRACLRALLDLVAQHPDMRDDVLDELRHLLARRHVPPGLQVTRGGSQLAALAVVIDFIASLTVLRRRMFCAVLDNVAQHPETGDDALATLRDFLTWRRNPPRLRVIAGGSQVAAPCRPTLRGVPPTLKVVQGGRAPS